VFAWEARSRHDLQVAIEVRAIGNDLFEVWVTPPEAAAWRSSTPLTPTQVLKELSARGCHSTAITDALDESGADWRPVHDAEVLRRRGQGA
jgi:hypothetical protein